jgi:hypothetical protein
VLASDVPVLAGVVREHGLGAVTALTPDAIAAAITALRRAPDDGAARAAFVRANTWEAERIVLAECYRRVRERI